MLNDLGYKARYQEQTLLDVQMVARLERGAAFTFSQQHVELLFQTLLPAQDHGLRCKLLNARVFRLNYRFPHGST